MKNVSFLACLIAFFHLSSAQAQIRYFQRTDPYTDSVAGISSIYNYAGKIWGIDDPLKQPYYAGTKLLSCNLGTGKLLEVYPLDSVTQKWELFTQIMANNNRIYGIGILGVYHTQITNGAFFKFDTAGNKTLTKELPFSSPATFTNFTVSYSGDFYAIGYMNTDTNSNYLVTVQQLM